MENTELMNQLIAKIGKAADLIDPLPDEARALIAGFILGASCK